ncbi:MAG: disulfide bond formation protein DsbA [Verrucomicrobia bacterium]|nr:MAG: disulfide bond formation protein DsbA [Verrucomicrobiota bacterium]
MVGFVTLGAAIMLYRSKLLQATAIPKAMAAAKERTEEVHVRGPANAAVTLEEFGDFQCPPCGALEGPLRQIERDYASSLRVIFRNFPFTNHEHAHEAAYAAEAAGLQGRFWEMHDLLYREQSVWAKSSDVQSLFDAYAGMIGLNLERFKKDVSGEQVKAKVEEDRKRGEVLGVRNTPTIFINDESVPPTSLNPSALRAAVDAAVKQKTRS